MMNVMDIGLYSAAEQQLYNLNIPYIPLSCRVLMCVRIIFRWIPVVGDSSLAWDDNSLGILAASARAPRGFCRKRARTA